MFEQIADAIPFDVSLSFAAVMSAALLGWMAIVYFVMAAGVRYGELVWSGRHVGRLPVELRWWGLLYGLGLVICGVVLLDASGVLGTGVIPNSWSEFAVFAVMCFLGLSAVFALLRGSTWERMFLAPISLLGAGLAAWLLFS